MGGCLIECVHVGLQIREKAQLHGVISICRNLFQILYNRLARPVPHISMISQQTCRLQPQLQMRAQTFRSPKTFWKKLIALHAAGHSKSS